MQDSISIKPHGNHILDLKIQHQNSIYNKHVRSDKGEPNYNKKHKRANHTYDDMPFHTQKILELFF